MLPRRPLPETPITLSGITDGLGDTGQILTVTATSSNSALIPNPAAGRRRSAAGAVGAIAVTSGGTGYAFPPVVTIYRRRRHHRPRRPPRCSVPAPTQVWSPSISFTGGSGYTSVPTVTIAPPTATAVATAIARTGTPRHGDRDHDQRLDHAITSPIGGSGYSSTNLPTVTIAPPVSGTPATATAIVNGTG